MLQVVAHKVIHVHPRELWLESDMCFPFHCQRKTSSSALFRWQKAVKKVDCLDLNVKKGKILASQLQLLLIHLDLRGYRGKEVQNETSAVL